MMKFLLVNLLAVVLLASACTPTPAPQPQHQTWIDKPLQNMTISVWTPPGPGSYKIQVRSLNGAGDYGQPVEVDVTVVGDALVLAPTEEEPTATPTDEPVEIAGFGAPQYDEMELFYRGSCGPKQLTVEIMTNDPDVYSAVAFFRLRDQSSQATTEWTSAAMSPLGEGYFHLMLSIEGDVPDFTSYAEAYLQLQFVATDLGGNEVGRTDVFSDVTVESCAAGISG
jgi:hypothetical protein